PMPRGSCGTPNARCSWCVPRTERLPPNIFPAEFREMKSRYVFPRHTKADLPMAVGGEGAWLIDADGKRYLDASGGAAVSCLGHSDPDVIAAIKAQADTLAYAHTAFFTSPPAEALAEKLVSLAP